MAQKKKTAADHAKELKAATSTIKKLETEKGFLEKKIEPLNKTIEDLKSKGTTLTETITTQAGVITKLKSELKEAGAKIMKHSVVPEVAPEQAKQVEEMTAEILDLTKQLRDATVDREAIKLEVMKDLQKMLPESDLNKLEDAPVAERTKAFTIEPTINVKNVMYQFKNNVASSNGAYDKEGAELWKAIFEGQKIPVHILTIPADQIEKSNPNKYLLYKAAMQMQQVAQDVKEVGK